MIFFWKQISLKYSCRYICVSTAVITCLALEYFKPNYLHIFARLLWIGWIFIIFAWLVVYTICGINKPRNQNIGKQQDKMVHVCDGKNRQNHLNTCLFLKIIFSSSTWYLLETFHRSYSKQQIFKIQNTKHTYTNIRSFLQLKMLYSFTIDATYNANWFCTREIKNGISIA